MMFLCRLMVVIGMVFAVISIIGSSVNIYYDYKVARNVPVLLLGLLVLSVFSILWWLTCQIN